jgi:hypothetical protein
MTNEVKKAILTRDILTTVDECGFDTTSIDMSSDLMSIDGTEFTLKLGLRETKLSMQATECRCGAGSIYNIECKCEPSDIEKKTKENLRKPGESINNINTGLYDQWAAPTRDEAIEESQEKRKQVEKEMNEKKTNDDVFDAINIGLTDREGIDYSTKVNEFKYKLSGIMGGTCNGDPCTCGDTVPKTKIIPAWIKDSEEMFNSVKEEKRKIIEDFLKHSTLPSIYKEELRHVVETYLEGEEKGNEQ